MPIASSPSTCPGTASSPDQPSPCRGPRTQVARVIEEAAGGACCRRRPVARRLRRDGSRGAPSRARPRARRLGCHRRTGRSPGGALSGLAWVMGRFDGPAARRASTLVLPDPLRRRRSPSRSSPAGSGRPPARRRCGRSSGSASSRAWPPTRARPSSSTATCDLLFRLSAKGFARAAQDAAGSACAAPRTSPTSTDPARSTSRSAASSKALPEPERALVRSSPPTGLERGRC